MDGCDVHFQQSTSTSGQHECFMAILFLCQVLVLTLGIKLDFEGQMWARYSFSSVCAPLTIRLVYHKTAVIYWLSVIKELEELLL